MPKGPSGEKRPSCPSGCQGANPMQCIFPVNQLADAGAVGSWLCLIAIRCTFCGCVYTGFGTSRTIRGWYDGQHPGWMAVHA